MVACDYLPLSSTWDVENATQGERMRQVGKQTPSNGTFLRVSGNDVSAMSRHQGYHSVYNDVVQKQLNSMNVNQSVEVLQKQVIELQTNLRYLQEQGLPLYKGQGATVDMWMRALEKMK